VKPDGNDEAGDPRRVGGLERAQGRLSREEDSGGAAPGLTVYREGRGEAQERRRPEGGAIAGRGEDPGGAESPGEHRATAGPEIWTARATDPGSGEKALKPSRIATVNGKRATQAREGLRLELGEKL